MRQSASFHRVASSAGASHSHREYLDYEQKTERYPCGRNFAKRLSVTQRSHCVSERQLLETDPNLNQSVARTAASEESRRGVLRRINVNSNHYLLIMIPIMLSLSRDLRINSASRDEVSRDITFAFHRDSGK